MKRFFTLSSTLKIFLLLSFWSCLSTQTVQAQVNADCVPTNLGVQVGSNYGTYCGYGISSISYGTLSDNPSNCNGPYQDKTSISGTVTAGIATPMTLSGGEYNGVGIYADFNKDGDFNDAGEFLGSINETGTYNYTTTFNVTVPGWVTAGNYRLRILTTWGWVPSATEGCIDFSFQNPPDGSAVDYTLTVVNTASCFPPQNVTASVVQANNATVTWAPPPSTSPNGYRWVLVPSGQPVTATPVASGGTNSFTTTTGSNITGLTANTCYDFYVRSGCSALPTDSSVWAGPLAVCTPAPPCGGQPQAVTITTPPTSAACYRSNIPISATDPNTTVSGITYQWQRCATSNGFYVNVPDGIGPKTLNYVTAPVTQTWYYRLVDSCTYSNQRNISTVYAAPMLKYTIPYSEDFATTANDFLPSCFERNNDAVGHFSVEHTYVAADGTHITSARADFATYQFDGTNKNAFFTIPALDMTGGTAYSVQFNYSRSNSVNSQHIQLYVNSVDPGTASSTSVTQNGTKIFDTTFTDNTVQLANITYTPPSSGTYYFTWYDNSYEGYYLSPSQVTSLGIANINIYQQLPCAAPTAQATAFTDTANSTSVSASFTAPTPAPNKYIVLRTQGNLAPTVAPANGTTYTVGTQIGNADVAYVGKYTNFTDAGLTPSSTYTYTVYAYNDLCTGGPTYDVTTPLVAHVTTSGVMTYYWNQSVSGDFNTASNWTPARTTPDQTDRLVFNNTTQDTVVNVPTQTITRLSVINNTSVRMRAAAGGATLSLASDNDNSTNELVVNNNSSLISDGSSDALTINFAGVGATASIAGDYELVNTGVVNKFDFTGAVATVATTGQVAAGGTNGTNAITSNSGNLIFNGTYNHKYTTVSGGWVPYATWNTGSTVLLSGYTTATGGPTGGLNQTFYNMTYSCPGQTSTTNWSGTGLTLNGTLTVASTGSGTWAIAGTQAYTYTAKNFTQTGGTLDLANGNGAGAGNQMLSISGTFNQSGGTLKVSGTGSTAPVLNFNGATNQSVNFYNSAPAGQVVYRISNPAGITLTGTGTLTSAFNINSGGGVRISTAAVTPLTTSLTLSYAATGSTLTYDTAANYAMTANVFPTSNPPYNLTINVGPGYAVTMPFNRTVGGTLTFTSGDIDLGANALTIGTSASSTGSISGGGSGNVRITTGSLTRWIGTTVPTSASTSNVGYFPIASGLANRNAYIYFSGSSITSGGTITVTHDGSSGIVPVGPVTDGSYTINNRTIASWSFSSGNGLNAGSATLGARVTGAYLFTPGTIANLRLMQAASVVGTHVAGSGSVPNVNAERSGLTLSQLTGAPYYIGASTADMTGLWTAINTGNWNTGSTWDIGIPPNNTSICLIKTGVTVTVDNGSDVAKNLSNNGTLVINSANTLTIDSAFLNSGTVNMSNGTLQVNGNTGTTGINNYGLFSLTGGTVNVGPTGGSNKPFNNYGTLTVTGGTLNINGNLLCSGSTSTSSNSVINQSGGNINVDGNAAGVAGSSVASGTAIVSFKSQNVYLTGGTITIVDPHVSTTNSLEYTPTPNINISANHTFQFGDGTSSDPGGSNGFRINSWVGSGRMSLGSVIINGANGSAGTNRFVSLTYATGFLGNVTINNGGEFRPGTTVYLNGNLTVNTGGTYTAPSSTYFASYTNGNTNGSTNSPQTVSGGGTFRNSTSASPTANFNYIYFYNSNNPGVTFSTGGTLSFSNTIYFNSVNNAPSVVTMANGTILREIAGAGTSGVGTSGGWVNGKYEKHANSGGISHTYPVGDANYYTPVTINNSISSAVSTGGDIIVSSVQGTHPNISTSGINPAKAVQRYYTIDTANGITFLPSSLNVGVNWMPQDLNAGTNTANFIAKDYSAGSWSSRSINTITGTSLTVAGVGNNVVGAIQIGEPCSTPVIESQPTSQSLCTGSPVTFGVTATGTNITYQWYHGTTAISGATDSTYTIASLSTSDAGDYKVVITSTCAAPITSNIATLSITPAAAFTTQPTPQTVCAGAAVTFTTTVTGAAPVTYQWQRNGANISGATTTSYSIPAASLADAGTYTLLATNTCGTTASSDAILTVNPLPVATITSAGPTTICDGSSIILSTTSGTGNTYQWYQDGTATGTNSDTLTANTAGGYTVTITDANGCTATSSADTVTILSAPVATATASGGTSVCQGNSVTISATTGTGNTYQWQNNGANISGASGQTFDANTSGNYSVIVTNANNCSDTSSPVGVTINALPNTTISASGPTTFCDGGSVTLNANPTGSGFIYQWEESGTSNGNSTSSQSVTTSGSYTVTVTDDNGCTATSAAKVVTVNPLPMATITPAGATTFCPGSSVVLNGNTGTGLTYAWSNGFGTISTASSYTAFFSGTYTLTVKDSHNCSATSTPVTVSVNPASAVITPAGPTNICQGSNVVLDANSGGTDYQWYLNNVPIPAPGGTQQSYTATAAGNYKVAVTNSTGCTATSFSVNVTVTALPVVSISAGGVTTFCAGGNVTLTASAANVTSYQWQKNGIDIAGATASTYTASTSGTYTVVVSNSAGCSATSNSIDVNSVAFPIAVITPSGPTSICFGTTVTLNATGGLGYTYQWYKNNSPISGATGISYAAGATGDYTVKVTNGTGCSVTSSAVSVYVNPIPAIHPTGPTSFCWGSNNILTVNPGPGNFTYQWQWNGANIPNATDSFLTVIDSGYYNVIVTVVNSCSQSSTPITITVFPLPTPVITLSGNTLTTTQYSSYQWYTGNNMINGATSANYTPTEAGNYRVLVTDANGCSGLSNVYHFDPSTGITNVSGSGDDIKIYPNPATSVIHIDASVKVNVTVSSIEGKAIISQHNAKDINIGDLANGIYMVRVYSQDGTLLKVDKLIKNGF